MRTLGSLIFPAVLLSTVLAPSVAMAKEPHSWCVTGTPLNNPADVAIDGKLTSMVVTSVCDSGNPNNVHCCD